MKKLVKGVCRTIPVHTSAVNCAVQIATSEMLITKPLLPKCEPFRVFYHFFCD